MARIGILTCGNCCRETNCSSVICLRDMRERRGFFDRYPADEPLDLVGITACSGCPTLVAPDKILKKVRSLADYDLDALHLAFCMTALCPFKAKYKAAIEKAYPGLTIVEGTHQPPADLGDFKAAVHEMLCPSQPSWDMNDRIQRKMPPTQPVV